MSYDFKINNGTTVSQVQDSRLSTEKISYGVYRGSRSVTTLNCQLTAADDDLNKSNGDRIDIHTAIGNT